MNCKTPFTDQAEPGIRSNIMATMTIKSRKTGEEFSFWMNGEKGYIFLESEGRPGCLGSQICEGGRFLGSTLSAYYEKSFESTCRRWYRAYQRRMNQEF